MNRRGILETASVAGAGLVAGTGMPKTKVCRDKPVIGKNAYRDRMGLGVWINDVRTESLPFDTWPPLLLDDVTEQSIVKILDLPCRLRAHRREKEFWTTAVAIVSQTDSSTLAHLIETFTK